MRERERNARPSPAARERSGAGRGCPYQLRGRFGRALEPVTQYADLTGTNMRWSGSWQKQVVGTLGTVMAMGVGSRAIGNAFPAAGRGPGVESAERVCPDDLCDGVCAVLCLHGRDLAGERVVEVGAVLHGVFHHHRVCVDGADLPGGPRAGSRGAPGQLNGRPDARAAIKPCRFMPIRYWRWRVSEECVECLNCWSLESSCAPHFTAGWWLRRSAQGRSCLDTCGIDAHGWHPLSGKHEPGACSLPRRSAAETCFGKPAAMTGPGRGDAV